MTEGPHRSADFVERCHRCDDEAIDACARCRRPWCDAHGSLDPDLCGECEAGWLARKQAIEATAEVPPAVEYGIAGLTPAAVLALLIYGGINWRFGLVVMVSASMLGLLIGGVVARALNEPLRLRAKRRLRRARIEYLQGREPPRLSGS